MDPHEKEIFDKGVDHGLLGAAKAARASADVLRGVAQTREAQALDAFAESLENTVTKLSS